MRIFVSPPSFWTAFSVRAQVATQMDKIKWEDSVLVRVHQQPVNRFNSLSFYILVLTIQLQSPSSFTNLLHSTESEYLRSYLKMRLGTLLAATATAFTIAAAKNSSTSSSFPIKSGIKNWADPDTPDDRQTLINSRGRKWDLVMSDEFNVANRSFRPGDDHLWTSLDKPDGVNGALEIYAHNMTSTKCDGDTCYFYIEVSDEPQTISVYNMYTYPPGFEDAYFYYRAGMVQSWNNLVKWLRKPTTWYLDDGKPRSSHFLGFDEPHVDISYNKCEPDVFNPEFQRIGACDDDPGYELNPIQGRGAPEIDVLEGGGLAISSSLQIAPGMPTDFRLFPADAKGADATSPFCVYSYDCKTKGANVIDVPTSYFQQMRGHKSWYQGLRYGANNYCQPDASAKQDFTTLTPVLHPWMSMVNGDMGLIDNKGKAHWGINSNGTCYPIMNSYMVEWVTGENGYVRWMLNGAPIFEVTTDAFSNVPQNANKSNPVKVMLEEPMYLIFNLVGCDGADEETNRICDEFPMYMKIDYIRLYQDLSEDLPADSYMQLGCDPKSHPTKDVGSTLLKTGTCVKSRCVCSSTSWSGPRYTEAQSDTSESSSSLSKRVYGPPMNGASLVTAKETQKMQKNKDAEREARQRETKASQLSSSDLGSSFNQPKDNYKQNFV
ncbi:hypothetical protein PInf_024734 [Phytophthora infestans]|nr:hypothetical protein PInf_024734 [Phytophthora infestans]